MRGRQAKTWVASRRGFMVHPPARSSLLPQIRFHNHAAVLIRLGHTGVWGYPWGLYLDTAEVEARTSAKGEAR